MRLYQLATKPKIAPKGKKLWKKIDSGSELSELKEVPKTDAFRVFVEEHELPYNMDLIIFKESLLQKCRNIETIQRKRIIDELENLNRTNYDLLSSISLYKAFSILEPIPELGLPVL